MRKLVLTMSIGALALIFSAGAFAEDATTPSAPQVTPQAAPAPQGSLLQGAQIARKAAGAQPVLTHTRHHHRNVMTGQSAKIPPSGSGKNADAAASAAAPNKVAMVAHTTSRQHHRMHHRSAMKPQTSTPPPAAGAMGQTNPAPPSSSVK